MAEQVRALSPDDFKLSPKYHVAKRDTDTVFRLLQPTEESVYLLKGEVFDDERNQTVHLSVYENLRTQVAKTVTFRKGLLVVRAEDVQTLNYMINSPLNRDSPFRASYNRKAHWVEVDNSSEELESDRKFNTEKLAYQLIDIFTVSQAKHTLKTQYGQNSDNVNKLVTLQQMLKAAITKDYFAFVKDHATDENHKLLAAIIHAHQTNALKYHKGKWSFANSGQYITTVSHDEYADEALLKFLTEPQTFPNPKEKENYESLVKNVMAIIGYSKPVVETEAELPPDSTTGANPNSKKK